MYTSRIIFEREPQLLNRPFYFFFLLFNSDTLFYLYRKPKKTTVCLIGISLLLAFSFPLISILFYLGKVMHTVSPLSSKTTKVDESILKFTMKKNNLFSLFLTITLQYHLFHLYNKILTSKEESSLALSFFKIFF